MHYRSRGGVRARRSRRGGWIGSAASLVLVVVAVAGCGGDDAAGEDLDIPAASETSPSPSPSGGTAGVDEDLPPGLPTDAPAEPTGLEEDGPGAKAYAEYVFRMLQFHTFRRDITPVTDLGRCPSCEVIAKGNRQLERQGVYDVPDEPPEPRLISRIERVGDVTLMGVSYDLPAGKRVDEDGEVVGDLRPDEKKYMEIAIRWEDGAWGLYDLSITD